MMKFRTALLLFFAMVLCANNFAQERIERQHRIKRLQFPDKALKAIAENSDGMKRLKFYREVDTAGKTYTAKFKKARLSYQMDFNQTGEFENIGLLVNQIDIPNDSFKSMMAHLSQNFENIKIRKMWQSYPIDNPNSAQKSIKNAFQNLMVPKMLYKFLIRARASKNNQPADYMVVFDAEGKFVEIKKSLPANYDRVLY